MSDVVENLKTTVVKPIVYGNVSRYLGKKREEDGRTHQWTAFLRPYNTSEDLSTFIRKVQFKLHESYSNPIRIVNKPPFELTETGWGEFDITMKVIFTDPNEKPLIITHLIKLFHCDHEIMMGHKSLVREIYDEMVFVDPSPSFYRALMSRSQIPPGIPTIPHETDFKETKLQALYSIQELNRKVTEAIEVYKKQLISRKGIIEEIKSVVNEVDAATVGTILQ
ncbi:YEATS domain-containing protein [Schistosoma japonicum]|uniref:YEATS domain-containing protein n=3 Tax=Schistosoma TaxID=6181 RepID=C1LL48_SCHJA|nr:YEATS domain-containing protein 4 [Schistosoma japonicum]KAH8877269.1 YEATS domain-containing protein 4 [Schistosoma japonicum]KAH8877270.1 YEATS domain-containing protein 4 [Schistosoma japonicum]KAH8877271.1 YEATS domain-containing protein 4 [Schistosoma japonicum]KAH8877272.1 YEATS domain-containing protein 4 [Schistosoma japonicum]